MVGWVGMRRVGESYRKGGGGGVSRRTSKFKNKTKSVQSTRERERCCTQHLGTLGRKLILCAGMIG